MLISEGYRSLNKRLHETDASYGTSGANWAPYLARIIADDGYTTVLDYGCGKGIVASKLGEKGIAVVEYDPAIPGKEATPEPADLVVCTDVLEHIEPVHLNAVLRDLRRVTIKRLFFNISTGPALKKLDDGRNAHLIIKPAAWWRERLSKEFQLLIWEEREGILFGEAAPIGAMAPKAKMRVHPAWAIQIDTIKAQVNKYADAFSKIDTVHVWRGLDDDKRADMVIATDGMLEGHADMELALTRICRASLKATVCVVKLTEAHPEGFWRRLFDQRFRIAMVHVEGGQLVMIGAPMVGVQGIVAVGAVDTEKRWDQVKAACERIPKRIKPAPAHEKRAILACYGPSLESTLPLLKAELAETGADVISVSGSHDFLLSHGIVPKYHVECDPRPHKADNIEKSHPDVQYLIASTVHEVLFNKLEGADVRLWHVSTPEHSTRLVDELGECHEHVISGGGSVGLRAIPLFYAMGYRSFSVYAMDCSFVAADTPDGVQQWAGKHAGKRQQVVPVDCDGRVFLSSPILLTYATNFFETIQKVTDLELRMYGDGLLQSMCRLYTGMMPHVTGPGDDNPPMEQAA